MDKQLVYSWSLFIVIGVLELNACEWTTFITTLANVIAKDKTPKELELIIALIDQLEDTLIALAILKKYDEWKRAPLT